MIKNKKGIKAEKEKKTQGKTVKVVSSKKPLVKKTAAKKTVEKAVRKKEEVAIQEQPKVQRKQVKVETVKAAPIKIGSVKAAPVKIEPIKIEPVKTKPIEIKPTKPEPAKIERIEPVKIQEEKKPLKPLELDIPITVKDLAIKIQVSTSALIKYLIEKQKTFVTINQSLNEEIVKRALVDFGFEYQKKLSDEEALLSTHISVDSKKESLSRPPVITLMGHVDHGKTSLLDVIRRSKLAEKEHGGITQHIGAYEVETQKGRITFLDTPGHEAFTAMRARGANITDIVILVVAADDGIMPQTIEAIDHAKAAGVPIVVAINKIDKPSIDIDNVKRQLSSQELTPEDWGGKTITVGVSAKTGQGIDKLLDMILLEAEMLELKAVYDSLALGVVIDAKLSRGQGPVATVLVQCGTLKTGDNIICGVYSGKLRAMINDLGQRVEEVTPGRPVEILGLSGIPQAGEKFYVLDDERKIKEIVSQRQTLLRQRLITPEPKLISLDELYAKIQKGEVKELNLILKADVQGSLEAIKESLLKIDTKEVKLNILHTGIGPINASDVILAEASKAIIIGFHVEPDTATKELANTKSIDIRTYRVIYELINEIRSALEGLLAPKIRKVFLGRAVILKVFNLTKSGAIAGCLLQKGRINRQATVTLSRESQVLFEGSLSSLKRFKDDVREVTEGLECGIALAGFIDYKEGDIIEAYSIEKIARTL